MSTGSKRRSLRRVVFGSVAIELRRLAAGAYAVETSELQPDMARLYLVRSGSLRFTSDVEAPAISSFTSGDAAFAFTEEPCKLQVEELCDLVTVWVPEEIIGVSHLPTGDASLYRVAPDSTLLPPVTDFILRLLAQGDARTGGFSAYYIERLLQEMLLGLLVDANKIADVPRVPRIFTHALSVIAAQRTDPELTSAMIAREVSLSLRQLERVFQENQTTIGNEIRRARVDLAASMLRDPAYDGLSIEQIGQYVGLSGGSSLARAMAREGHETPVKVRSLRETV